MVGAGYSWIWHGVPIIHIWQHHASVARYHSLLAIIIQVTAIMIYKGSVIIQMHPGKTSIGPLGVGGQIAGHYKLQKWVCDRMG